MVPGNGFAEGLTGVGAEAGAREALGGGRSRPDTGGSVPGSAVGTEAAAGGATSSAEPVRLIGIVPGKALAEGPPGPTQVGIAVGGT